MEVMVRNLPDQVTENKLDSFFRPFLNTFGIHTYHCARLRSSGCAKLTILDPIKGRQFLAIHGQTVPGRQGFGKTKVGLRYMGRPVNCCISKDAPDPWLLKSLRKDESDRYAAKQSRKPDIVPPAKVEEQVRAFDINNLACGQWQHDGYHLAFATHFQEYRPGRLVFTNRSVFVKLYPTNASTIHQLEIPYYSITSFVTGSTSDPSLTFSLSEAPKLFRMENTLEDVTNAFQNMGFKKPSQQGNQRTRIMALCKSHEIVVSSCLCYRFVLSVHSQIRLVQNLRRQAEIPQSINMGTSTIMTTPFAAQMTNLNSALATGKHGALPFDLKFQMQKLAHNGYLAPSAVVQLLPFVRLHLGDGLTIVKAVRRLFTQIPYAGPETEASDLSLDTLTELLKQNIEIVVREQASALELSEQYDHIASIHKATITPTGVYLYGPDPEVKNRVLRKYSDFPNHFLSVSFLDEDGEPLRYDRQTSNDEIFDVRFKKFLEGSFINIGGRGYDFLGFSHSSLRAKTCWFMAPFTLDGSLKYARSVIKDLGDFSKIRSPAKCAARIGQAFSQTLSAIPIPKEAICTIPDVIRNDRVFSDGVGTCSTAILHRIWDGYDQSRGTKPTILQIRFQGAKGMISLDSNLTGEALCLRDSMIKFDAPTATDIEICGAGTKPLPMYLNRQLIKILEDLGVPDSAFLDLQANAVERLRMTTVSAINASTFLRSNYIAKEARLPWLVRKLWDLGLSFSDDHFLRNTLEFAVLIQLREIKHRSRVRVEKGFTLYGIMDETGFLQEGQIYCSVHTEEGSRILTGDIVITRSPALHPGDAQSVQAVDVPDWNPLRDLHNVVVFSSMGERDLPSQLSGGDLDGDLYNVIYDNKFHPTRLVKAADYTPAKPIDIGRRVERSDMTDFFVNFMKNDALGRIATLHVTLADQMEEGTLDEDCIILAGLHSTAVDFSKTGIPVNLAELPKHNKYRPDFQAPGPRVTIEKDLVTMEDEFAPSPGSNDELEEAESYDPPKIRYYESQKILGKLYREIDEVKFFQQLQSSSESSHLGGLDILKAVWRYVKEKTALIEWKHHIELARDIRESYEENLADTMLSSSSHFVSEIEVFTGSILGKNGAQNHRQRESSKSMKDKHDRDTAYAVQCIVRGEGEDDSGEEALERSIACLYVARRAAKPRKKVGPLYSFAWIAAAVCLKEVEDLLGR